MNMKRLFSLSVAAALAWGGGFAAPITIVSPKDGATVPLLKSEMKEYLAKDRAARKVFFADEKCRKGMSGWGDRPESVTLEWEGDGDKYKVEVKRAVDGKVVCRKGTSKHKVMLLNLEIATEYLWQVSTKGGEIAKGRFTTEAVAPRLVRVDGIPNVRDLGGRIGLDGRRVRQGLVYRSGGLNNNANKYYTKEEIEKMLEQGNLVESVPELSKKEAEGIVSAKKQGKKIDYKHLVKKWEPASKPRLTDKTRAYMRDTLGIRTDIDLRTDRECYGMKGSPLGEGVKWVHVSSSCYGGMAGVEGKKAFAEVFRVFLDKANYPIDFHCIAGADRTGALAFILNGLLGVEEEELWKDWEVTAFQKSKLDFVHKTRFEKLVAVFDAYPGVTINERIVAYVKGCGFTDADIAAFRGIML